MSQVFSLVRGSGRYSRGPRGVERHNHRAPSRRTASSDAHTSSARRGDLHSFPDCDYTVSMADGYRRVQETVKAFERKMASEIARLVAEETRPLRAALEASKLECEALRKRATELEACIASRLRPGEEQSAIPGLPDDLVVAHILGSANLSDPTDVARLTAVSRGMRAAVAATKRAVLATKLTVKKPEEGEAVMKGYLSTLKHMHSRGRLSRKKDLCEDAARGGHLDVLKWARENDCPWDEDTCWRAAWGGHLDAEVGARERLPVEQDDVLGRGIWRPPRGAEVGARERLPVGQVDVHGSGEVRPPRGAEVGARERLPVGRGDVRERGVARHLDVLKWARENGCPWDEGTRVRGVWRPPRCSEVGALERLPVGRELAPTRDREMARGVCVRIRNER